MVSHPPHNHQANGCISRDTETEDPWQRELWLDLQQQRQKLGGGPGTHGKEGEASGWEWLQLCTLGEESQAQMVHSLHSVPGSTTPDLSEPRVRKYLYDSLAQGQDLEWGMDRWKHRAERNRLRGNSYHLFNINEHCDVVAKKVNIISGCVVMGAVSTMRQHFALVCVGQSPQNCFSLSPTIWRGDTNKWQVSLRYLRDTE